MRMIHFPRYVYDGSGIIEDITFHYDGKLTLQYRDSYVSNVFEDSSGDVMTIGRDLSNPQDVILEKYSGDYARNRSKFWH